MLRASMLARSAGLENLLPIIVHGRDRACPIVDFCAEFDFGRGPLRVGQGSLHCLARLEAKPIDQRVICTRLIALEVLRGDEVNSMDRAGANQGEIAQSPKKRR